MLRLHGYHRHPANLTSRLAAALAVTALLMTVINAVAADHVRNERPQRPAAPVDEVWPVSFTRDDRALARQLAATTDAPEALLRRFFDYHSSMRYEEALDAAQQLEDQIPDHPVAHYNVACALARLQRVDEATDALERAIACGWRDARHAALDPDLAALRRAGHLQPLIERMRTLEGEERIVATPRRTEPWPQVVADLEAAAPALLERYHVPGVCLALVRDGAVVWSGAFGNAGTSGDAPLQSNALFNLSAPQDLIALIAAARLADQGHLNLRALLEQGQNLIVRSTIRPPVRGNARTVSRPGRFSVQTPGVPITSINWGLTNWPDASDSRRMPEFLRVAVDVAAADGFETYCRENVLDPLHITPRDAGLRARGHSRLGTPITTDSRDIRPPRNTPPPMLFDAADLAQLMTIVTTRHANIDPDLNNAAAVVTTDMEEERVTPVILTPHAVEDVINAGALGLARLGLNVHTDTTPSGRRMQVTETAHGVGCLLRWFPDTGDGIVILFNSAAAPDLALRLAHTALGGR